MNFKESVRKSAGNYSLILGAVALLIVFLAKLEIDSNEGGLEALGLVVVVFITSVPMAIAGFILGAVGLLNYETLQSRLLALVGLLLSTGVIIYLLR